jgi:beta-N-acetylhexosaminidase
VIFTDDLSMAAAEEAGDYGARARDALAAGCDMVLVCNNPDGAGQVLDALAHYENPASQSRLLRMHGRGSQSRARLHEDARWHEAVRTAAIHREANLALNL